MKTRSKLMRLIRLVNIGLFGFVAGMSARDSAYICVAFACSAVFAVLIAYNESEG